MKKDDDWKQKIAKEWNDAADEPGAPAEDDQENIYNLKQKDDDQKSHVSYSKFCDLSFRK